MGRFASPTDAPPVLSDGAWGTELQCRGLAPGEPSDLWNLTRPGDVEAVARSYVEAGSRVLLTNTFRSNPIALAVLGEEGRAGELNRAGVRISREAAGPGVRVFGSIGPTGLTGAASRSREAAESFALQAAALAGAGVDALVLETFGDLEEARQAAREALRTGLPVVASFAFVGPAGAESTYAGVGVEEAARALAAEGVDAVGANCLSEPAASAGLCLRLSRASGLPIWIKPSAGLPTFESARPAYRRAPADWARDLDVPALRAAGAGFVGGCCGAGPSFIRALADELARNA